MKYYAAILVGMHGAMILLENDERKRWYAVASFCLYLPLFGLALGWW